MKKLLGLIAVMALGLTTAFAQTPAAAHNTHAKTVMKKEVKKAIVPVKETTKTASATMTSTKVKATTLKKDGTPDMRLKENKVKAVVKPVAHLKKDGTRDMRYKTNKTAKTK